MYQLSDKRPGSHPEPISETDSLILELAAVVGDYHFGVNTTRPLEETQDRDDKLIAKVLSYFHTQKLIARLKAGDLSTPKDGG
jgi:hypothetical protein